MNPPIRVAMIIQSYFPRVGGAERQIGALAPLLRAQNVEIAVLTRRHRGLVPFENIDNVPVHRLPVPGPASFGSIVFILAALPLLQKWKPHVIHAHELLSPTMTALAAKRRLKIPVAAKVLRGGIDGDLAKLRRNTLSARRIKPIAEQVDAFITISREIDAELAAIGVPQARRHFIPNGVNLERFAPVSSETKRALRAQLALPDVPIAIFTGRLAQEKRLEHLIGIWDDIRARYSNALLLLVGAGPDESALKRIAGEGVRFVGATQEVPAYLRAADFFVLPSATEGLSNALLEAMATGLPVIATMVGGAADVITPGENGLLIPADDKRALHDSVMTILGDAALRERLGHSARERVMRDYALPQTALKLRTLYDELIQQRAR